LSEPNPKLPTAKRDLPKSVTLSGRDLEEARRLLALFSEEEEEDQGTASELARLAFARRPTRQEQLALRAREILALRQKRAELFGPSMFGEPACWVSGLEKFSLSDKSVRSCSGLQCSVSRRGRCSFSSTQWLEQLVNR